MTDTTHNSAVEARELAGYLRGFATLFRAFPNDPMWGKPGQADDAARIMERASAALAAMPPQAPGWRPISEAPRDGTEVLVYVPRRPGPLYAGAINSTGAQWWSRNLGDVQPTHWQPLPTPPSEKSE